MKKSILDVVHESAKDMHEAGVISDMAMKEYDALCLPEVSKLSANQIKRIRRANNASQSAFAAYLNTSKSTVQQWEQGVKTPNGISLKLLNMVEKKGIEVLI
jgi:putative transcriptional regulator